MSYYKKTRSLYKPGQKDPYQLSRSKIELFVQCRRCFFMDARMGLGRPSIPAFTLNSAVDALLKNEFDLLRKKGQKHELMEKYAIDCIPFDHPDLPLWRGDIVRFEGAKVLDKKTNLLINGLVDDLWKNDKDEICIVDYKSTSSSKEVTLDGRWKEGYKRQIEMYQWIFRQLDFKVSNTGYFVYANALKNLPKFDGRLEFTMSILPYTGKADWVPLTLMEIKETLESDEIPDPHPECEYCAYRKMSAQNVFEWKKNGAKG